MRRRTRAAHAHERVVHTAALGWMTWLPSLYQNPNSLGGGAPAPHTPMSALHTAALGWMT